MKKCKQKLIKLFFIMFVICLGLTNITFGVAYGGAGATIWGERTRESITLGIRALKVGWLKQGNLMNTDENGKRYGYTYEYLMRIKQYTGWNYDFVEFESTLTSFLSMKDQLKSGNLDLVGGMRYVPDPEFYDIAIDPYCMSYTTFATYKNNDEVFSISDLMRKEVVKIAVQGASNTNQKIQEFCTMNKINYIFILCDSEEAQKEKVKMGEVDVFPIVDFMIEKDFRIVAKFDNKPVHFVTTAKDSKILLELNSALAEIESSSPQFRNDLYKEFFDESNKNISLTKEEKAYVSKGESIPVIINPNVAPFQYKDEKGNFKGITYDLMEKITQKTDLKFDYVLKSGEDYRKTVQGGGNFIIGSIAYEYETAENLKVLLTTPYVSTPMLLIANSESKNKEPKDSIIGVVEGSVIEDLTLYKEVKVFKDIKSCIDATESGEVDFAYGNSISMSYYGFQANYKNLIAIPIVNQNKEYCIAISNKADKELFSIINKALRSLDKNEISSIITGNTENYQKKITLRYLLTNYPLEALGVLLTISVVGIAIIVLFFIMKIKSNRQLLINAKRYEELSEISGEYIIEFDIKKDLLTLTHTCADLLGLPQINNNASKNALLQSLQPIIMGQAGEYDLQIPLKNKELNWFKVVSSTIRDNTNKPVSLICKLSNTQEETEEKQQLLHKSTKDDLTQLFNIGYFKNYVMKRITYVPKQIGIFFIFDLDGFKNVNDTYGHLAGDKVLKDVANKLQEVFKESSCIARLGGDEFVIYVENMGIEGVRRKADSAIRSILHLNYDEISISCGICYTIKSEDYDEIYNTADKALYQVKQDGGNNYKILYDTNNTKEDTSSNQDTELQIYTLK